MPALDFPRSLRWPLCWALSLALALHFALGSTLGLTGDEAHYALYAANLDWSYYDHPPLVGWIQWPLVALGAGDAVLRLIPQALWLLTVLLVAASARRLHRLLAVPTGSPEHAAVAAVLVLSLAPLLHILGIGLLPDTLLMACTAAVLWQTLRLWQPSRALGLRDWVWLGLLLGLAGLSKYTAVFLAVPVVVCLLVVHGKRLLARPGPWLALGLAVLLVVPVFVWNAQHGWISFIYQLKHGAGSHWEWRHVGVFLLAQLLIYGPLLPWGGWLWLRAAYAQGALRGAVASLLGFFALPFAVLLYLSGGGSGLPHWTAPAWVAWAPFASLGLSMAWTQGRRGWLRALGALQAVICGLVFALMLLAGWPGSAVPVAAQGAHEREALNPFTDFYGWEQAGERARALAASHGLTHLAVQNWTLASRFAWYARPLPVHVLDPGFDQFSLWSGELPLGANALLLDWSQMAYELPVGAGKFERCEPLSTLPVARAGRTVASFRLFACFGWQGQPAPRRIGEP